MAEYIERERLVKHYENCIDEVKNTNGITEDFEICLRALKNQPAADVAEVKHGKWEVVFDGNAKLYENMFECSVCKTTHVGHPSVGRYCPNCGAKMDLGDDEG